MAKGIDKKLDTAWSLLVKLRAGMKCEYCGKTETLNSHHIYTRRNRSTRWNVKNGICLCVSHHTFNSTFSAHQAPLEFIEWLKTYRNSEEIDNLKLKANSTMKFMKFEKEKMLEELQNEIFEIKKRL